jgi:hypothetical protein
MLPNATPPSATPTRKPPNTARALNKGRNGFFIQPAARFCDAELGFRVQAAKEG